MQTQRQRFVNDAYQQAREAGLNDAQARLAASQAALETGFGKSVVGNNYFGIKAGSSWNGPTVTTGTWEEEGGKAVKQNAKFRSYESPVQSFQDWGATVGRRWAGALSAPTFAEAVESLRYGQPGGYATDSRYGSKLRAIDQKYGPQAERTDGIMAAINPQNVPTPQMRPGLMEASYTPGAVERREIPSATYAPQQQVSLDTLRQAQPAAPAPSMSLADQYASYGAGKVAPRMAGLLAEDVAHQGLINKLNEQKKQLAAGVNPMDAQPAWATPGIVAQPAAQPQTAQINAPPEMGDTAGLMPSAAMPMRDAAADQALARQVAFGLGANKMIGGIGGGLLGGMMLGPLGAMVGGLLGRNIGAKSYHPPAPSTPQGKPASSTRMTRDTLSREGRGLYDSSAQVRSAVDSGRPGLY